MTRHRTVTWLLLSCIIAHCYGQDAAQNRLTLDELKASVNRERNGDPGNLIYKAAQSGDRSFIPYIRTLLVDSRDKHLNPFLPEYKIEQELTGEAELALSKLGETDQLQRVYCEVWSDHPWKILDGLDHVRRVGGWFGIQVLEQLFDSDERYNAGFEKYHQEFAHNDVQRLPPSKQVLVELPELVPNSPRQSPTVMQLYTIDIKEEESAWRDWIAEHRDPLSKVEPTGEGVDLSRDACPQPDSTKQEQVTMEDIKAGVERGDTIGAIRWAGQSHNKSFIPYLRSLLTQESKEKLEDRYSKERAREIVEAVNLALAKLGEKDRLQAIFCDAASNASYAQDEVLADLEYVGGWFSIRIIERWLDNEGNAKNSAQAGCFRETRGGESFFS